MSGIPVTLIEGDGVGPEVVGAARRLIDASGAGIDWETRVAGAVAFKQGIVSGVPADTLQSLQRTRVALKGPLETPVGYGEKSANVTLRKLFETYGNIRPVRELPGVSTPFSGRGIDFVLVRENVEDLYAGIEHQQTPGVAQCLKLISRKGCEKIARLAFEVARAEGRTVVHCATKANIMKLTEGLMKKVFEEVALDYPGIKAQHLLVDNCAHQLVMHPEEFQVIVTTNMNGDILSDLASGLVGGLGFAPSYNLGDGISIFEAVHGSAPDLAGKDLVNPVALIQVGVLLLRHLGLFDQAALIENALLFTLEKGLVRTRDFAGNLPPVGTQAFTQAVLGNFGRKPSSIQTKSYRRLEMPKVSKALNITGPEPKMSEAGVDIFVQCAEGPAVLGQALEDYAKGTGLRLRMISNRGVKVYPGESKDVDLVDHYRCRFVSTQPQPTLAAAQLAPLLEKIESRWRWMHVEKLPVIDGALGFTRAHGEE